ncbi:MAG: hypothetical protein IJC48_06660 [Clostridia bacterium]|nr:hypothetical protein [Clostridia bacterium]
MTDSEKRVYRHLAEHRLTYRIAAHKRVSAISECVIAEKLLGGVMPRNLFLSPRNESHFYLLIAHPESVFRTSSVSRQAGASRLSFGSEEALGRLLHTHSGAVSPLGLIFDEDRRVTLLVDRKLLTENALIFHPLENTASVRMEKDVFFHGFLSSVSRDFTVIDME